MNIVNMEKMKKPSEAELLRVDAFVWESLTADAAGAPHPERKGRVEEAEFLAELDRFAWHEQAVTALGFSPTISVTDLKSDRTLFFSPALGDDDSLAFFVGSIAPACRNILGFKRPYRRVEIYEASDATIFRSLVSALFQRDEGALAARLATLEFYTQTAEDGGWKRYLNDKREYVKLINQR